MSKTIEGLYYSQSHEWVKVEGNTAFVGITDYAQEALGSVVYVDMPQQIQAKFEEMTGTFTLL